MTQRPGERGYRQRDRVLAFLRLPHAAPIALVLIATATSALVITRSVPDWTTFGLMLAAMLGGQIAIGALNELRDLESDRLTKPERPLPSGVVTEREASLMVAGGLLLMLIAAWPLGMASLLLLVTGTGCGLVYDLWLKRTVWSWVPYALALPLIPIWVAVTLDTYSSKQLIVYPVGIPIIVALHLAQSLSDADKDRRSGDKTLIAWTGRDRGLRLIQILSLTSTGVSLIAAASLDMNRAPLVMSVVALGVLVIALQVSSRSPQWADQHLFKFIGVTSILLAGGWFAAL